MKIKTKLLLIAAFVVLALPLMFAGTASARFMEDGATPNPAGGWNIPTDFVCVVGVHANGTLDIADGVTSARDCIYLQTGTMNGGTPFDLTTMTNQNDCTKVGSGTNDGAKHSWATSWCSKSLTGLDRTQQMCTGIGGTWVTTGKCVAYIRQFKGQNASGTPLAFGTEGTTQAAGTGFCYASMDFTAEATYTSTTCPSYKATNAPFDANAAYDWSFASSQCRYAKGIAGKLVNALTKTDGTTYAAASYIDLSAFTTMGDCLANGGSWSNWGVNSPVSISSIVGTDSNTYKRPVWDYTRQAPDADNGCLHCHSTTVEYNGPAERFKDSYVKTGHKNMLRKVIPGNNLTDADGNVYTTDGTVSINFGTGTVTGGKKLFYVYGDWMVAAPTLVYETVAGNNTSTYSCGACHTAGYSDATTTISGVGAATVKGTQSIGTSTYSGVQPQESFPSLSLGTLNPKWDLEGIQCGRCHNAAVGPVNATMIAASSYPSTHTLGGGMGSLASGVGYTNLCFGCHQAIDKVWPAGTTNTNDPTSIPTGTGHGATWGRDWNGHVIGNSFLNSAHARFTGTIALNALGKYDLYDPTGNNNGNASKYDSDFQGYTCWQSPSSSSPAKTKADGSEITNKTECETLYGAGSWRSDSQGTCVTCHDVHNSLFVPSQAEAALRKTCEKCHVDNTPANGYTSTSAPQVILSVIKHPSGTGTPFDTTKYESACVVCHMAQQQEDDDYNTLSLPAHLWRINTDASYSTFPSMAQFYGGSCSVHSGAIQNATSVPQVFLSDTSSANCTAATGTWTAVTKTRSAQTAPDGTYTNAVWVDLDMACGQCHGGSAGPSNTANSAPYFDKNSLSVYATDMHSDKPTANFISTPDGSVSLKVNFNAAGSTCPTGYTCTYEWDFNNDAVTDASGITVSNTFAGPGTYPVTLTVTATGGSSASVTKSATAVVLNTPPVVGKTGLTFTNLTVSFTDASTDDNVGGPATVYVNWGDGSPVAACGVIGSVCTKTYAAAGTYNITHYVKDAGGLLSGNDTFQAIVPAKYFVNVTTSAAVQSALVQVKQGLAIKAQGYTSAAGTWQSLVKLPTGAYTATITKAGVTFDCDVAVGIQNPVSFSITAGDVTINCTH